MSRPCPYCGEELCLTHCVYCMTDCSIEDPEHGPACPSVTGRYPIPDPRNLDHEPGFCCRCEAPLAGSYYLVLMPDETDVYEAVCFECKIDSEVAP